MGQVSQVARIRATIAATMTAVMGSPLRTGQGAGLRVVRVHTGALGRVSKAPGHRAGEMAMFSFSQPLCAGYILDLGQRFACSTWAVSFGHVVRDLVQGSHCLPQGTLQVRDAGKLSGGASESFNLGNGQGFSVQEVIDTARQVTGKPIAVQEGPRRAGDPARLVADATAPVRCWAGARNMPTWPRSSPTRMRWLPVVRPTRCPRAACR